MHDVYFVCKITLGELLAARPMKTWMKEQAASFFWTVKSGGWNPYARWKGESALAELVRVLSVPITAAQTRTQESVQ